MTIPKPFLTDKHALLSFENSVQVLSSAPLNGGLTLADHILILRVSDNFTGEKTTFAPPSETLQSYADECSLKGTTVGMMTSAYLNTFRHSVESDGNLKFSCSLTAGISNARRAGDPADWNPHNNEAIPKGTINIILGTSGRFSPAAITEALMIATETKAAVMQELNIISPISSKTATGTGTDAIAIFNGTGEAIPFCGKHTCFGEMVAKVVSKSLTASLRIPL